MNIENLIALGLVPERRDHDPTCWKLAKMVELLLPLTDCMYAVTNYPRGDARMCRQRHEDSEWYCLHCQKRAACEKIASE